jgi:hypothetical protein
MIMYTDHEADLLMVLSRLSSRYLRLLNVPASRSPEQMELLANGRALFSAIGNSCE